MFETLENRCLMDGSLAFPVYDGGNTFEHATTESQEAATPEARDGAGDGSINWILPDIQKAELVNPVS